MTHGPLYGGQRAGLESRARKKDVPPRVDKDLRGRKDGLGRGSTEEGLVVAPLSSLVVSNCRGTGEKDRG